MYEFPQDLVEASRTCRKLTARIDELPYRAVTLADGTPVERRRPAIDYDQALEDELAELRRERLAAAVDVVTHTFWVSVDAGDRTTARTALHEAVRS
ncbi:hypothetical protein HUT18_11595 [Streptomyces sp. NA04227]|uniref:hypothetical protein n=1 Tax=Streptomyces sp. NA04227 TaxID=2742136 RepID=UPI001591D9A6|nr:hypothetical protein [Streptomyces sp. NA04227]QKW06943.1 hypothetical protein HUT18_11595 [Streptomyces sp. NA04227]